MRGGGGGKVFFVKEGKGLKVEGKMGPWEGV